MGVFLFNSARHQVMQTVSPFRYGPGRRLAWCRANTLVVLFDQLLVAQLFITSITSVLFAHLFMHVLGESLSQKLSQRFHHNAVVVITSQLVLPGQLISSNTSGYHKAPHVVGQTG